MKHRVIQSNLAGPRARARARYRNRVRSTSMANGHETMISIDDILPDTRFILSVPVKFISGDSNAKKDSSVLICVHLWFQFLSSSPAMLNITGHPLRDGAAP